MWLTLERNKLIKRSSGGRFTRVTKLLEDGSERAYTPPSGSRESRRELPYAYWTSGVFTKLDMPAKTVLLIAMSLRKRKLFLPSTKTFAGYYGISASTLHRGITTLHQLGILTASEPEYFVDSTAPSGVGSHTLYSLAPPYDRSVKIEQEEEPEEGPPAPRDTAAPRHPDGEPREGRE
ncbi:helix-turn-helix domain-containing protein [Nonomuraea sp. NPDC049709]|uniref:helix-turn-helix domain-containing protein n=1 Tax=Nonomuraea sp. NPDC049709 TaxID=3154736 RepID=UPI0034210415